ncbi:MAG TPA: NAD(P)-dependent alcohol dehydrogenase [Actinophytocola sp.]|uniref:NAD(P)-dependent alcohol dehydrogenase n=1 Tax=Actinophytocola sp. TaxID=1872138 RepID=UPI002DBC49B2|nr:NAD(P)-dependent alcohol dehydrogenase [Actinophytocola sp.]HEU5470214.1 NAD(P)-dependent alcohol dehydrogenase [Actinophytocola sp.]
MKAIVQDAYGSSDRLALRDIDPPVPGAGEVLVKVRAAGVDPGVWILMAGIPYVVRPFVGLRTPRTPVRGREVAGVVEAVGPDVTRFRPGDEVFGIGEGTYAEYVKVRQRKLAPKPANLSFEQAAAVPISGCTALQALRDAGRIRSGQRVLVIGAAGGVGTFAVQLARHFGAEVTGVCSTSKMDLVRSLGATHVIDYTTTPLTGTYDLIIDTAGNRRLSHVRRLLTPRGTLVHVGASLDGKRWSPGLGRPFLGMLLSPFVRHRMPWFLARETTESLTTLADIIATGAVTPVIDRTYPLPDAPAAIDYVHNGHTAGKSVITM